MFTDSLSAAEFSFSTYIRPFKSTGSKSNTNGKADSTANHHHAVEEALWVAMAGQNVYVPSTGKFKHGATGGALSSIAIASGETDADSGDRTDGTYNIAIPTVGADADASATVTGGTQQGGTNAVIKVVVSSGTAVATITERGTKFETGQSITIGDELMGGDGSGDALVLTATSESFTSDATDLDINFYDSSRASLGTFNLYFVFSDRSAGRLLYKLKDAVVELHKEQGLEIQKEKFCIGKVGGNPSEETFIFKKA